jgi:hypothetical protein
MAYTFLRYSDNISIYVMFSNPVYRSIMKILKSHI